MRPRWQRPVQSFRQSLSWLRVSQDTFGGVDCDLKGLSEPQAKALGGGTCVFGDGVARSRRPWFRVCYNGIIRSPHSSSICRSVLGTVESRLRTSDFFRRTEVFSTLGESEHKSDDNGRDENRGLRLENEQTEIVSRFEKLLQSWSSNTPLLLNDLQIQLTPAVFCQVVTKIPKSDAVRNFFKWANTQPNYQHSVYTYASVLDHYGKRKNFLAMDQVVSEMKEAGIAPSLVTFTSLMFWHSQITKLGGVRRVWQQIQEAGLKPNEYIYSSYIDSLVKNGCHEEAMTVFQEMQDASCRPNIFTFSVMIRSLVESLQLQAACELYERMRKLQFTPNSATYNSLVKAHAKEPNMDKAVYFYREMLDAGLTPPQSLRSLLSAALTGQGRAKEAEELTQISAGVAVENLKSKALEAVLRGSLPRPERLAEHLRDWGPETELVLKRVKLHLRHPYLLNVLQLVSGEPEIAWRYFEWVRAQENYNPTRHMFARVLDIIGKSGHTALQKEIISEAETRKHGNAVTYDSVIQSYCLSRHTDAALLVFERMKEQGIQPDASIYTMLVDLLARTRGHPQAMEMYADMLKAKCKPTVHTYTVILHSLARSGRVRAALTLFEKLPSFGVPPTAGTFTVLLRACLKTDELEKVLKLYASMRSDGIAPSQNTHRMVTRGLHAAGMHDEADALSDVPIYFPEPKREVVAQRTPKARKSATTLLRRYYVP